MIHNLKSDPAMFEALSCSERTAEYREDDRGYEVGDELWLEETSFSAEEMKSGKPLEYTGRIIPVTVTHVLRGPEYGIPEGYALMSIVKK